MKINKGLQPNNATLSKRLTAYLAIFSLLFQPIAPAIGAVLSDGYIQDRLNSYPSFEKVEHGPYQYQAAAYVEASAPAAQHLETFYSAIQNRYRHTLGKVTYVPISTGDITSFIPVYKQATLHGQAKLLGTPLVQSRYIRSQIQQILGRHLIDSDSTEATQLNALYNNALTYITANPEILYGEKLELDQENTGLALDMVWPEFRQINNELVLVPVVYLSDTTIAEKRVDSNVIELQGPITLKSLTIDQVDVHFGRDTFLKVANDLLNNQGKIEGDSELQIVAGGSLTNLSGVIKAQDDLRIGAHSIENKTILHRYTRNNGRYQETGTRYGEIAAINSSDGSVTLRSHSDIIFLGAGASAGGALTLAADGNILLGSQVLQSSTSGYRRNGSSVSYLRSSLTAEETLKLIANGQIVIDAAEIVSDRGHIEILAGMGITIEDDLQQSKYSRKFSGGGETAYKSVAIRSILDAGKGVRIQSAFGDITLKATDITSTEGTRVEANDGAVNLLMTVENDHYSYSKVKKGLFTTKVKNKGRAIETGVPNSIVGGLVIESVGGVSVEYEGDPNLSMDEQIAELARFEGLEWMADVRANTPDADWEAIETQYKTWNKSRTSLSPAFAAVIAIAVAVSTGGAGASAASAILGSAATTAAGSLTIAGAMIAAGTSALISQATLALANGVVDGDVAGAMQAFASDETFKSIAVAMVTAGAIRAVDASFFNVTGDAVNPDSFLIDPNSATQITNAAGEATVQYSLSLAGQTTQALTHAAVSSGISSLAYGGDFDDQFVRALNQHGINHLGKYMANKIKVAFDDPAADTLDTTLKYISHAGVGCIIGAATASNNGSDEEKGCAAGAGGGVIGELVGDIYRSNSEATADAEKVKAFMDKYGLKDPSALTDIQKQELLNLVGSADTLSQAAADLSKLRQQGINIAKLSAAIGAFVAGADAAQINIAATNGENAAANNAFFLIPAAILLLKAADIAITVYELNEFRKDLEAAGDDEAKRTQVIKDYLSAKGGEALTEAAISELVKRLVPGGKLLDKIMDVARERGIVSGNKVDQIKLGLEKRKEIDGAEGGTPKLNIRDHYNHHQDMVDDIKDQLRAQGYNVSNREVSFGSSCSTGRCRPDIIAEAPDGSIKIIEIKTGNADLSIRQSEIFPQIENGNSIPRGRVAEEFGLIPGVPLKDQGYPNGIPIEVQQFPGAQ